MKKITRHKTNKCRATFKINLATREKYVHFLQVY